MKKLKIDHQIYIKTCNAIDSTTKNTLDNLLDIDTELLKMETLNNNMNRRLEILKLVSKLNKSVKDLYEI